MKIRNGFVSNSSSSSFICNICGENVSGMDMCSKDAEMYQCTNGHVFCESHGDIDVNNTLLVQKAILNDNYAEEEIKDAIKNLNEQQMNIWLEEENYPDYLDELEYEMRDCLPMEACPICNFEALNIEEAFKYLLRKNGMTKDSLKDELKLKYKDYNVFLGCIQE